MKFKGITIVALMAAVVMISGCKKEEPAPPATPSEKPAATITPAPTAEQTATQAADAVKKTASDLTNTATNAMKQATATMALANEKFQGLVDTTKKLMGDNKYEEAMKIVNQLLAEKLSPEQQTIVNQLKEQIEKALSSKLGEAATKAVGDMFKK